MQQIPPFEHGKRYRPLSQHYLERFGEKVYKVSVSVADSCPNRESHNGMSVCVFCDEWGSAAYHQQRDKPIRKLFGSSSRGSERAKVMDCEVREGEPCPTRLWTGSTCQDPGNVHRSPSAGRPVPEPAVQRERARQAPEPQTVFRLRV